jgi:hypothetical protein
MGNNDIASNEQLSKMSSSLSKIENQSKRTMDNIGLIWLTLIIYIIYIEFFK